MDGFVEENPVDTLSSSIDPPSFPLCDVAENFVSLSFPLKTIVLSYPKLEKSLCKLDEDLIDILKSPNATKTDILNKELLCNVCGNLFNRRKTEYPYS